MKKTILTAATIAALLTKSAVASAEGSFYIKATGGYSKLDKVRSFKSQNTYFIGFGVGYNFLDNVRADVTFEHFIDPVHKGSRVRGGIKRNHKTKGKVDSLALNGYVDLFDISLVKVFVGAGIGASQVEAKNSFVNTRNGNTSSVKFKKKTNITYAIHAGVALNIAPGVNGELFYSYRDLGKTKKNRFGHAVGYKGHQAGVGIRVNV